MPLPALAAAAIAAAPAIGSAAYKIFAGGKQVRDGKKIDKNNKFIKYERSGEVRDALALSERNYLNGMPGSDLYENRIGTSAAMAMESATQGASSSGDVLDAATKISQNTNNALLDLGIQEDEFKQRALGGYTDQLENTAQYADKEFNYNVAQPYQRNAAAASALIGAGNQNVFSGVDEGLGAAASALRSGLMPPVDPNAIAPPSGLNMGQIMGNTSVQKASTTPMVNTMGQLPGNVPLTMGTKYGKSQIGAASAGLMNSGPGRFSFSNPALSGKWIVDPATGSKRWAAN